MNESLASVVALLEQGARRNRTVLTGLGISMLLLGIVAFLFLDPATLGSKAYFARLLLPPLGLACIGFAWLRKPKVLAVLRDRPRSVVRWSIAPSGRALPLVLTLDDGTSVAQDLNVHDAQRLRQLLPTALPHAVS